MLDPIGKKHKQPKTYWVAIEAYFESLPRQLYRQGQLLRNDLAVHFSSTGELRDILTRAADYPPQALPGMLLDDLGASSREGAESAEEHLFTGFLFTFFTLQCFSFNLDEPPSCNNQILPLGIALSQAADRCFNHLFLPDSPFWKYHREFWGAHAEAALIEWQEAYKRSHVLQPEDVLYGAELFAPFMLIPVGAALRAGQPDLIPDLLEIFQHLHAIQKILQDLASFPRDLDRGKITYPLIKTFAELGTSPGPHIDPGGMLLAMAMIGINQKIDRDLKYHLEACQKGVKLLGLKNLLDFIEQTQTLCETANTQFHALLSSNRLAEAGPVQGQSRRAPFPMHLKRLDKAIEMAKAYLQEDLSFKESWEVHRYGLAGSPLVTARFPATLIMEVLCSQGVDLSSQVDAYFQHQKEHNHQYYDHPDLPFADSDNLASLLVLSRYSNTRSINRKILAEPLEWMHLSQGQDGRIPIWIHVNLVSQGQQGRGTRLLGEGCGAIETRLLLALIDYDWQGYQEIIQRSAAQLLLRFLERGTGITVNYPRGFLLWKMGQLIDQLTSLPVEVKLNDFLEKASQIYPGLLRKESGRGNLTPQEAAFLILASGSASNERHLERRWISILLNNQRSDGSWFGEPMFFVPIYGAHTAWHASHLLTTTFCYRALSAVPRDL